MLEGNEHHHQVLNGEMSVSVSSVDREEIDTKWEADQESTSNVQWKGNENESIVMALGMIIFKGKQTCDGTIKGLHN